MLGWRQRLLRCRLNFSWRFFRAGLRSIIFSAYFPYCAFLRHSRCGDCSATSFHESSLPIRFIAAGLLTAVLFSTSAKAIYTRIGSYRTNDWSDVVGFIESHSTPEDTVLFWGAETGCNFSTQRRSPAKFAYLYPLYRPGYLSDEDVSGFFNELESNPPLWIVDTKNPMTPFLEIPVDSPAKMDFQDWFYANCTKTDEIQGWIFYRWNGSKTLRFSDARPPLLPWSPHLPFRSTNTLFL